jgi:hypothetical protein
MEGTVRDCLALVFVESQKQVLDSLALAHDLLLDPIPHFIDYLRSGATCLWCMWVRKVDNIMWNQSDMVDKIVVCQKPSLARV